MGRILHAGEVKHPSKRSSTIASLFGVFSRKRSAEKIKNKENKKPNIVEESKSISNIVAPPYNNFVPRSDPSPQRDKPKDENNTDIKDDDDDYLQKPLAPPPSSSFHFSRSYSMALARAASGGGGSSRKLRSSLSMRLSLKGRSGDSLFPTIDKKDKKLQREDSLWKKTIILGDKCKVPDSDEDDDTILYDGKGNIISAYHKRTPPGSRQTSFIDVDAVHAAIAKN